MKNKTIETPYKGKKLFRLEKYPHYTSGKYGNYVKTLFTIGKYKFAERIVPKRDKDGSFILNSELFDYVKRIGCKLEKVIYEEGGAMWSFSFNKQSMGNERDAYFYMKNKFTPSSDFPRNVALKYDEKGGFEYAYGYTHRGGAKVAIGDRMFDADYAPQPSHYDKDEWEEYAKKYAITCDSADEFDRNSTIFNPFVDGIKMVIPFNRRGKNTVKTISEAVQSAIKISNYLD